MEPISAAIVAAIAKLAEPAIKDAYTAFKGFIIRKFGQGHDLVEALDNLEKHPASGGRAATLDEELVNTGALSDPAFLKVAHALLDSMGARNGALQVTQTVTGNSNVVAGHDAHITFDRNSRG